MKRYKFTGYFDSLGNLCSKCPTQDVIRYISRRDLARFVDSNDTYDCREMTVEIIFAYGRPSIANDKYFEKILDIESLRIMVRKMRNGVTFAYGDLS